MSAPLVRAGRRAAHATACAGLLVAVGCSTATSGRGTPVLDVGGLRVVGTTSVDARTGRLSPDGASISLESEDKLCFRAVSGGDTCTTRGDHDNTFAGSWSPDGSRYVTTEPYFLRFVDPDIEVIDTSSGEVTDLTDDGVTGSRLARRRGGFVDLWPSWSGDGTAIRFARTTEPDGAVQLCSVAAAGGKLTVLGQLAGTTMGRLGALVFSADGTTVFWTKDATASRGTVYSQAVDGSTARALVEPRKGLDRSLLSLSADGRYLLVSSQAPESTDSTPRVAGPTDAEVIDLRSHTPTPVAGGHNVHGPTWSPAGHALASIASPTAKQLRAGGTGALMVTAEPGLTGRKLRSGRFYAPDMREVGWSSGAMLVGLDDHLAVLTVS